MRISPADDRRSDGGAAATAGPKSRRRLGPRVAATLLAAICVVSLATIRDPVLARTTCLVGAALVLWLGEAVPPYVVTLALLAAVPLVLGPFGASYRLPAVLGGAADPVLALFLGGFALGVAASRHGIDAWVAALAVRLSRGRRRALLALVLTATASLSMWISNIAAAAMMIAALRPFLRQGGSGTSFRCALLLAVALGANFGGMATPIGTGPNAIAIAELTGRTSVTFVEWMGFGLPLTLGMLGLSYLALGRLYRVEGRFTTEVSPAETLRTQDPRRPGARGVMAVFALSVAGWLFEPLHHVPAAAVALLATSVLFGTGLLGREDLGRIDWSTLLLIAGGIALGRLIERSGLVATLSSSMDWAAVPVAVRITGLVFASALFSALMSNTATAVMLIPLATSLIPASSTPVLVAIGASFGIPFVISTPPNAMVYGEGGVSAHDLLRVGLPLMVLGCLLVGLTGPGVLAALGLR